MRKLNIAVIGVGHLGSRHAQVYARLDNVQLIGVCDSDQNRAKQIARQYNIPYYTAYPELFNKVDAVSIAVPTHLHHKIAKDFLLHNVNVLVEKPITKTLKETDELLNIAKDKKLVLQVGHIERFNSAFTAIQRIAKEPKFIECHRLSPFPYRSLDIGVVLDLMIHDIDIILGLVKSEVKNIQAVGVKVLTSYEDLANARIVFKNGCVCNLTASRVSDEVMRKIRIFLEDTYISLDYGAQEANIYRKKANRITQSRLPIEKEEPLKRELVSFIDCVLTRKKPLVSGQEARAALKIALQIQEKIFGRDSVSAKIAR